MRNEDIVGQRLDLYTFIVEGVSDQPYYVAAESLEKIGELLDRTEGPRPRLRRLEGGMTEESVALALEAMGLDNIEVRHGKVIASCPNAAEGHASGSDSHPSYAVMVDVEKGLAYGVCMGCSFSEPLERTLLRHQFATGENMGPWLWPLVWHPKEKDGSEDDFDAPVKPKFKQKKAEPIFSLEEIKYDILPEEDYQVFAGSVPKYALAKGWTIETCAAWELGHDKKYGRWMFPVRTYKGQLVGWSGYLYRVYEDCPRDGFPLLVNGKRKECPLCGWEIPPKWLHSKGEENKKEKWRNLVLYGEHKVDFSVRVALLMEGPKDVTKVWQAGAGNTLASLGTKVGPKQLEKLRKWFDEVWIWSDPDKAGGMMMDFVEHELTLRHVKAHRVTTDKDPGKSDTEVIREVLKAAGYPVWRW